MTDTAEQAAGSPARGAPPTVWPVIRYRDGRAGIRFLQDAFGFELTGVYPEDGDGPVVHAELAWPLGGALMIGSVGGDEANQRFAGAAAVYVVTRDPDGLFERARAAGATVSRPLTDQDYGSREFSVLDPEGNQWSFGTYRGEAYSESAG